VSFLPYSRQAIDDDDIRAVVEVLRSDLVTQGPVRGRFEAALARQLGSAHVAVLATGSAALHAVCAALGVGPGDEVLVPVNTFVATASCVAWCGGTPVLVDSVAGGVHMSPVDAAAKITRRTVGIIAMHYGGLPCDLAALRALAERHGLWLVEDAAHAIGARTGGRPIGSSAGSAAAVFSFHPVKPVCAGEGGAVATGSAALAARVRQFGASGITKEPGRLRRPERQAPWYAEVQLLGANYRITEMQCALGLSQLGKLDDFVRHRNAVAELYREILAPVAEIGLSLLPVPDDVVCAFHLFPVAVDFEALGRRRAEVMGRLQLRGIGTQVHYVPLAHQPWFQDRYGVREEAYPNANASYARALSLPISARMEDDDVERVCQAVLDELGLGPRR
jgi:dTDP-4-amino-4,6-dideoxygalactose transaminase